MIIARLSGGLGNQMFQYAFGLAQAKRHGVGFEIDASGYGRPGEPRAFGLGAFNISANNAHPSKIFWYRLFKKILSPGPAFSPAILTRSSGYFRGYWQTEKYFIDIADRVRAEFTLKSWSDQARSFKAMIEADHMSVSLHVRRGDYAADPHLTKKHGLLPPPYYADALQKISERSPNIRVYLFSDDVGWVKSNLNLPTSTTYISDNGLTDQEELMLMSLCRHHIIANSSYSWWGAWLDPRKDKIVVAPAVWYAVGIDASDLVPESWIKI